ncbi:uncharacterized protein RMCFA_3241 [Mycolicibacterium fortuitum subsp. acetamidolyticum]|jgi:hypothetical protein|uniref:Carboxylesterase n=2 Tax=Mycolicibacterium fortuitum TaxID=1766 RepID=A0A124E4H3_MYCFO|nr:hypothetical protein MFORT_26884 [Mycolicibacterium fortuitum subsp. fortuitum DSM 46621 = ATCC 6841 = JCM 6387]OBB06469.1 carboxylesterase [Mycolicibacterium fortuitum]CRL69615.1 hypothetical protein CPGR_00292 [Mycolicibacter nonchromogenicus]BDD98764.1 hypothetical protein MFTT_28580 [Mycolicibacterium fortuitum subsp. fortuitum]GAT03129.1 uncharacterized protein RMCFA_3241 [Mycolicibacterium fortuitum subsp. acetamidolyticum]
MTELVSPDNFARAESDLYFANIVNDDGFGQFFHNREMSAIEHQIVIRQNRDTLYSAAVFDLDAGPVTITLPDGGGRFMSLQIISEDHYTTNVVYGPTELTFSRDSVDTRYAAAAVRILADPADPADLAAVHALQDAIGVAQAESGFFEIPAWDPASQKTVRDALITLSTTLADTKSMFGPEYDVDPVRHLIGSAFAWGGNPERDALYLTVVPPGNDGTTVHRLTVKDVPVDGFWSVTVYNKDGYFTPNPQNAYSVNNVTAVKDADGATTVQFGGGPDGAANVLPITEGWNYLVRLYRPRPEILDGSWTFPAAQPV